MEDRRNDKYKKYRNALMGMIPVAIIGFILAPHMPVTNIINNYDRINWLDIRYCKDTIGVIGVCETLYMIIIALNLESGNYRPGEEHGSAKLVSPQTARKFQHKENNEYIKAFKSKELKHRLNYRKNDLLPYSSNILMNFIIKLKIKTITKKIEKINNEDMELIPCPTYFEYITDKIKNKFEKTDIEKEGDLIDEGNNEN